jgi:ComF family protein
MLIQSLIELLTPEQCLRCGRDGVVFCATCVEESGFAKAQVCFRCHVPSPAGRTCEDCAGETALAGVAVGAFYDEAIKELILKLKFHRLRSAARAAADLVLRSLPEGSKFDLVCAVPVSASRYRERGYNQSELVARQVAAELGLPYSSLLGRTTSGHQMGRDRRSRLEQIRGVFYPMRKLDGQRVLIVDDVVTTGATLSECAGVLTLSGAGTVWGAAVARH